MAPRWVLCLLSVSVCIALSQSTARAQSREECRLLCQPELLIEPTWTIENLAQRPTVADGSGEVTRVGRDKVFELVLAIDVPTRIRRLGLTGEAIWSPGDSDNAVELEFEANFGWLEQEQTGGWVSSHFDIVDQLGPAERPGDPAAYTHKLDFELDTAFAVFRKLPPNSWLHSLEVELSLDYLATGLPRRGDHVDGIEYREGASPWSLSFVLVVPVAPR